MSGTNSLEIVRGDDTAIEVTFTDKATGDPIDLTGSTVMFTVRADRDDTDDENAIIKVDVTVHTDPTAGQTVINMTHEDTAVQTGNFFYDVQYVDTANKVQTLVIGEVAIVQDVTKRIT